MILETLRNRAGSGSLLACGVSALLALVFLQIWPTNFNFIAPLVLALVLAIAVTSIGIQKKQGEVSGAGVIAVIAVLVLCGWILQSQFSLYPDDVVRACVEALRDQKIEIGRPDQDFARSVLPPGLFCLPGAPGSAWVLVTPVAEVAAWSSVLAGIALALAGSVLLARHAENRPAAR
ncbi:MAG: hypothetical protein ACOH14_03565 [Rhodoglobus sp.]